ncbi:protein phosphatase regulatory subunit [Pelomyxa schiedti]|nr:protein phosphatase regulatory subunit [Pelomyxa schiedti]
MDKGGDAPKGDREEAEEEEEERVVDVGAWYSDDGRSLDLTHVRVLAIPSDPPLLASLVDVDLTHAGLRGQPANLSHLRDLRTLVLRANAVGPDLGFVAREWPIAPIGPGGVGDGGAQSQSQSQRQQLVQLERLDLYENAVERVGPGDLVSVAGSLRVLDLSFNLMREIGVGLEALTNLTELYFVQNKLRRISGLSTLVNLQILELGSNRIRKIEGLEHCTSLRSLWLGRNKIRKLENLGTLTQLRQLGLQSNRLTNIEGLESLSNLEELYISHNGITQITNLQTLTNLNTLDIAGNNINTLEGLDNLSSLEELWCNDNPIQSLHESLRRLRSHNTKLATVYLERSPAQLQGGPQYRNIVYSYLPWLTQIDALPVVPSQMSKLLLESLQQYEASLVTTTTTTETSTRSGVTNEPQPVEQNKS